MVEFLCIVSHERRELYEYLRGRFADEPLIRVVLDRRQTDRRRRGERSSVDRRLSRRRRKDIADDLRRLGWTIVRARDFAALAAPPGGSPALSIEGVTPEARALLDGRRQSLLRLPFTIVRGSDGGSLDLLEIPDHEPFRVSRRHCTIFMRGDGRVAIVDHGSRRGTLLNGVLLGMAGAPRHAVLQEGANEIAIGGWHTPYRFSIVVAPRAPSFTARAILHGAPEKAGRSSVAATRREESPGSAGQGAG